MFQNLLVPPLTAVMPRKPMSWLFLPSQRKRLLLQKCSWHKGVGPPSVKPHGRQTTKCVTSASAGKTTACAHAVLRQLKPSRVTCVTMPPGQQQPQETPADTFLEQPYKCQLCPNTSHNSTSGPTLMGSNQERTMVRVQGPPASSQAASFG